MADDIKIKLGLDATDLFKGLDQALNQVNTSIKNLPDVGDAIASDLPKASSALNSFVSEQKQLLVALKLQGKEGSDSYKEIEKSIIDAKAELNKLEQAAKDVDASLEAAFDGEAIGGFEGALAGLKGGLSDAFSGGLIGSLVGGGLAGGIQAGIGAIVDGFGAVVDAGRGLISAQGDLQAQTGATGAEFEALKKEAEDAFLGGVGESVAEATKVISNATTVLKGALPTEEIGEFTARAQALGNLYDKDVNEVISKSAPFIKQFGLDGDQAFNLIALAAKEGKTSQDDVLDTLAEYSQLLQEAGFSAEEFTGALVVAGQEGLFNTDKIADSIKEAQIRLKAGDTAKAFTDIKNQLPAALGDTLGNLEQLASSGQITIKEFLAKSGESIKTAFDSGQISEAMASQLQVAVAGTPAEDIGVEAYNKLFGAPIPTDEITKKATEAGQAAQNAVGQYLSFDAVGRNLSLAFETASASIISTLSTAFGMIAEAVGPSLSALGDTISAVFQRISSVVGPILAVIGGAIMTNISAALTVASETINFFLDLAVYAFDTIVGALQPLIDAIKSALGMDGAIGEGVDAMGVLQTVMNTVTGAIGGLFDILGSVAKLLIDGFSFGLKAVIGGLTLVVEGITSFVKWIGQLILQIPGVQTVFNNLKSAFDTVYNFFANLPSVINEVQIYLKAIGMTFQSIFGILQESFKAALSLDFEGAANKLASVFQSQTWVNAFSSNLAKARGELNKTTNEAKAATQNIAQAQKQANEVAQKPVSTAAKVAGAKAGAKAESFAKLDELKKFYEEEAKEIDSANKRKIDAARAAGQDTKELQARLDDEAAKKLRAFLNERLAGVKDNTELLNKEQINTVLKPATPKQMLDIETFYVNEFDKLGKKLAVEPKVKLPDFKDELKGFETAVKDIEKNTESLIPKALATSQEALDANTSQITKYLDFIKSQNVEIEQAKTEALLAGNTQVAESLDAQIKRNILSFNTLENKLKQYQKGSAEEIKKNTTEYLIQLAIQTSILDAFNTDKLKKEREANEALRAERLGALDAEEKDLTTSLAKREVSFEEYAAKMADIDKARQETMSETEVGFFDRLKEATDKGIASILRSQSEGITKFVTDQFKDTEGKVTANGKIIGESMTALTEQFASLAESGKATLGDFGNAAAAVAFDAVSKMIPSFVAGILGSSITALGPIAGPIAAGLLTASLQLLIGQAKAALGFKDGVIDLAGPGTETSDSIPAWLSRGESVITAASTKANKDELAWMNANPGMSIRDYFTSHAPQVRYSVGEDGGLIREVQKLREETRGLGRQINRNTHVSISGELKADNNSIKAVIESERRRNARRG
jgi:phage-related minor tail protein